MKKILFTGGSGFMGRNLVEPLSQKYKVFAPDRWELDLRDFTKLESFICSKEIDIVIHAAIPDLLTDEEDKNGNLLKLSLVPFMNLYRLRHKFEKMIYFGSGAEFDKTKPIISVNENDFGKSIPNDDYGFAKYIMNTLAETSDNIYNMRIFGCYGPTDAPFKLITSVIRSCLKNESVKLHQDCFFDYMHVSDLVPILSYFIESTPKYSSYNVCSGQRYSVLDIAKLIIKDFGFNRDVEIEKAGLNNEYTAKNHRLLNEIKDFNFLSLDEGIRRQIEFERKVFNNE
ncbi:MAG: NAD(P)-dependent oxidoreductase [Clostridiales bacterium]